MGGITCTQVSTESWETGPENGWRTGAKELIPCLKLIRRSTSYGREKSCTCLQERNFLGKNPFCSRPPFRKGHTFRKVGIQFQNIQLKTTVIDCCRWSKYGIKKIVFLGDFLHARQEGQHLFGRYFFSGEKSVPMSKFCLFEAIMTWSRVIHGQNSQSNVPEPFKWKNGHAGTIPLKTANFLILQVIFTQIQNAGNR